MYVGNEFGGGRIYADMQTCRHADNDSIVYLIFSNTKFGVVIKNTDLPCRHLIYVMCVCRQYRMGFKLCRNADMPTISFVSFENQEVYLG